MATTIKDANKDQAMATQLIAWIDHPAAVPLLRTRLGLIAQDKLTIQFVDHSLTGAEWDKANKAVKLQPTKFHTSNPGNAANAHQEAFDSMLWEIGNHISSKQFTVAQNSWRGGQTSLLQCGRAKSDAEAGVSWDCSTLFTAMQHGNIAVSQWAQGVINSTHGQNQAGYLGHFATHPHEAGAPPNTRKHLNTEHLYAYEAPENCGEPGHLGGALRKAIVAPITDKPLVERVNQLIDAAVTPVKTSGLYICLYRKMLEILGNIATNNGTAPAKFTIRAGADYNPAMVLVINHEHVMNSVAQIKSPINQALKKIKFSGFDIP
jgi:hypothetical protein